MSKYLVTSSPNLHLMCQWPSCWWSPGPVTLYLLFLDDSYRVVRFPLLSGEGKGQGHHDPSPLLLPLIFSFTLLSGYAHPSCSGPKPLISRTLPASFLCPGVGAPLMGLSAQSPHPRAGNSSSSTSWPSGVPASQGPVSSKV